MNEGEFPYLAPVIRESSDDDSVLQEILHLADEGLREHVDTIVRICTDSDDDGDDSASGSPEAAPEQTAALVTATHRLTNMTAALRLEEITRKLNELESLARRDQLAEFCVAWRDLAGTIAAVHVEVCRARRD